MADARISELASGGAAQATDELPVSRTATAATRKVTASSVADLKTWANLTGIPATLGDVFGPAASIDSEVALFSGTTGKLLKRSTGTGVTRISAGVQSAAELSGDATTSGSNAVTIANDAVTYAKMQNVSAASRLIGRGSASGAGDPEEIALGSGLSMSGTTLSATGGGSAVYATNQVTYNTDSTERALLTFTVTGGDLSTNKGLQFFVHANIVCNSGTPTITIRGKFGATTLFGDVSPAITASATRRYVTLFGMMFNNGSASLQVASMTAFIGALTAGSVAGVFDINTPSSPFLWYVHGGGVAAENSASSLTFSLTWQFSVSNVAVEIVSKAWAALV